MEKIKQPKISGVKQKRESKSAKVTPKPKIKELINLISIEQGLESTLVERILKEEVIKLAKEHINPESNYEVQIDDSDNSLRLFQRLKVVGEWVEILQEDKSKLISLKDALEMTEGLEEGDELLYELRLEDYDFSRAALMGLLHNFDERVQEDIQNKDFHKLSPRLGKIVSGRVSEVDKRSGNTIVEIDGVSALLKRSSRIKGEEFLKGEMIPSILQNIYIDKRFGLQVELSRTSPKFLEELLRLEVPEISDGEIEIRGVARIPGVRAKVALSSNSPRIDAIGSTVGLKGVRINAVSKRLCGESIDCVEYSPNLERFIANALSPASILSIKLDEKAKVAQITLSSDQISKAIGAKGANIRLTSMLLGLELQLHAIEENEDLKETKEIAQGAEDAKGRLDSLFKE